MTSIIRSLVSVSILFNTLSCGSIQSVETQNKSLNPAVTIEDGPGALTTFDVGTLQDFNARGPSDVALTANLEKNTGKGYILRLSWTFNKTKPTSWRVSGYQSAISPEGEPDPDQIEIENFQATGTVTYASRPLMAGLTYWYDIEAVIDDSNLKGTARLKTIQVDLTGAVNN